MGLDQYLSRKIYVGAEYEHRNVTGVIDIKVDGKPVKVNFDKVSYITESIAYWRKASSIHAYFVKYVQNGVDDCGEYDVTVEQLQELVDLCQKVLKTAVTVDGQVWNGETWTKKEGTVHNYKAGKVIVNQDEVEELLPTQEGFFFGGTDYDEWYLKDLENTINQLTPYLNDKESEFVYRASW